MSDCLYIDEPTVVKDFDLYSCNTPWLSATDTDGDIDSPGCQLLKWGYVVWSSEDGQTCSHMTSFLDPNVEVFEPSIQWNIHTPCFVPASYRRVYYTYATRI